MKHDELHELHELHAYHPDQSDDRFHPVNDQPYEPGEIVYVIYRNPHTQNVAHIQEAAVVKHPTASEELCLFLYETYYPIDERIAIYKTEREAKQAYEYYFGSPLGGDVNA